jgi:hypothetical protein
LQRRGFDHLFAELSVAAGRIVPRYALWLRIGEQGFDPALLSRDDVLAFSRDQLPGFLAEHDIALQPRSARRLARRLRGFDPMRPTPEEHLARMIAPQG